MCFVMDYVLQKEARPPQEAPTPSPTVSALSIFLILILHLICLVLLWLVVFLLWRGWWRWGWGRGAGGIRGAVCCAPLPAAPTGHGAVDSVWRVRRLVPHRLSAHRPQKAPEGSQRWLSLRLPLKFLFSHSRTLQKAASSPAAAQTRSLLTLRKCKRLFSVLSVCLWIRRGKHSEKLDVIIDFIAQERTHKPINSSSLKRLYNLLFTIAPGSYQTLGEHLAACPGGCGHKKLRLQKRELGSHLIDLKKKKKCGCRCPEMFKDN